MSTKFVTRPTTGDLESRIQEINTLDLKSISISELKQKLELLYKGYCIISFFLSQDNTLFRGIVYGERPEKYDCLIYPPIKYSGINRASEKGEPHFYCTSEYSAVFYELDVKKGDKLVISTWRTTRSIHVSNIGYTESNFKILGSTRPNPQGRSHDETGQVQNKENILVKNFFAQAFSQFVPKDKMELYTLTIAIAEKHYHGPLNDIKNDLSATQFEGLMYPTIAMNANADNLAIRPSVIDTGGLQFEHVDYLEVKNVVGQDYDINLLSFADSLDESGIIEWIDVPNESDFL